LIIHNYLLYLSIIKNKNNNMNKKIENIDQYSDIISNAVLSNYNIYINGIHKNYNDDMYGTGEIFDIYDIYDMGVNTVEYYYNDNSLYITIK